MGASLTVNTSGLRKLSATLRSPLVREFAESLPMDKGVGALVSQAIADNFAQEGPGWPALKAETIRRSVKGKAKKSVASMSDDELIAYEAKARKEESEENPHRRILDRTGLLKKAATIANFSGSNKKGQQGSNIWKKEGSNLVWGVDLVYARAQDQGNPKKNVPARPFLVLRAKWLREINEYVGKRIFKFITENVIRGGK